MKNEIIHNTKLLKLVREMATDHFIDDLEIVSALASRPAWTAKVLRRIDESKWTNRGKREAVQQIGKLYNVKLVHGPMGIQDEFGESLSPATLARRLDAAAKERGRKRTDKARKNSIRLTNEMVEAVQDPAGLAELRKKRYWIVRNGLQQPDAYEYLVQAIGNANSVYRPGDVVEVYHGDVRKRRMGAKCVWYRATKN